MTSNEIRESFKNFFAGKGHKIVPSAPMVLKDDPTLMFTNAGMNQFKDIILGNRVPECRANDRQPEMSARIGEAQRPRGRLDTTHTTIRCSRCSATGRFGDYFKQEAIDWAWEYLVDVLKLNPDRLYATVFEGAMPRRDSGEGTTRPPASGSGIFQRRISSTATVMTISGRDGRDRPMRSVQRDPHRPATR